MNSVHLSLPTKEIKICHDYPITHHHKFKLHIQIIPKYLEKTTYWIYETIPCIQQEKKEPPKEKRKKLSFFKMVFFCSIQVPKSGFSVSLRLTTAWIIETWQYIDNQVSIYRQYDIVPTSSMNVKQSKSCFLRHGNCTLRKQ